MNKTNILIVEDEGIVAADLAGKLAQGGYEVAGIAATGEKAVELACRLRPQAVLMDIWLKGPMDGIAAAEAILRQYDTPIIYLTAHSDLATLERAKLTGPFGYILKPFEERELATQIEMAIYKHQAERELRQQREWLRVTLSSIGDGVITCDTEGRVSFLNPVAEKLTGWKSEEALGQPIQGVFRIINEQTREPAEDIVGRVLREGCVVELANHTALVAHDGREIPIEDSAAPILDAAGQMLGVVLVFHDVTEKRRAQEALRQSEESFRTIADAIPQLAWIAQADGYITWYNRRWFEYTGTTLEQMEGWGWQSVHDPKVLPKVLEQWTSSIANGEPFDMVFPLRGADGRFRPFLTRVMPVKDTQGRVVQWFGTNTDIDEMKRAEEALARLAAIVESSDDAIIGKTLDGIINTWNGGAERIFGYTAEEAIGQPITILIPDDRQDEEAGIQDRLRRGEHIDHYETVRIARDGRRIDVSLSIASIKDSAGNIIGVSKIVRDITERKRAEERVRESEDRLRFALETSHTGAWDLDLVDHAAFRSLEHDRIFGYAGLLPQWTYEMFIEHVLPEEREMVDGEFRRAMENRSDWSFECRILRTDGQVRWIWAAGRHRPDASGAPRRMAGIVQDITERKQAEEELERQREWLNVTLTSIGDGVITCDTMGRVTFINPVAEALSGWKIEEAVGQPIQSVFRIINEKTRQPAEDIVGRVLREKIIVELANHTALVTKEGGEISIEDSAAPIMDQAGNVIGVVLVFHDVTQQRSAREKLRVANAQLAEADQRKDEFLAMLAHELRNPLAPIRNAVQIIKMVGPKESVLEKNREIIERQSSHMGRLLDDLLEVSRVTRGMITLKRERLDLRTVVTQAVEIATHSAQSRHLEVLYANAEGPVWLEGDPTRLEQVVGNLLTNALKFTDEGKIEVSIERALECGAEGPWAVVRVRDTGIGIPPEVLPRIFDLFTQADQSLERTRGGLGIGLTMVKRLVELHGGRVDAHSGGPGQGSEFIVYLPLVAGEMQQEEPRPSAPATTGNGEVPLKVLVVDDNQDAAGSLKDLLEMWGHDARTAFDGQEAVQLACMFLPDVVLLDIGLPGMSGYAVARKLREERSLESVKIIALTGYGQEEDRKMTSESGCDAHLVKPVDLHHLQIMLARIMVGS